MNIEIVTIGDELLLGFTVDTNAAHIARVLAGLGVVVSRRATVGDDEGAIAEAVADALARTGGVITTGGLGPTSDDRSKPAVAGIFGRDMVLHEPTLEALRDRWRRRGLGDLPVTNRNQAMVPFGATLLENGHGSAPGIWMENERGWVAMLPGVPREMRGMLADQVVPLLLERGAGDSVVASRTLRTTGVAESRIADLIAGVVLPSGVELAYLPAWPGVDLRLTIRGAMRAAAERALTVAGDALRPAISEMVYGEDDADLAEIVIDDLRTRGWTLAVAESCTGGMLGMRVTTAPGASDVFLGGVIAYDNLVKAQRLGVKPETIAQFGAVSDAVALEMAKGARGATGATVGIAITGVAGPGGGTDEKPVGTVSVAADVNGTAEARTARLVGDRDEVRHRATQTALLLARRLIHSISSRTSGHAGP